jgi:hypothetical protein
MATRGKNHTALQTGEYDGERILVCRTPLAEVYLVRGPEDGDAEFVVERTVALPCATLAQAEAFADPLVNCLLMAPGDVALVARRDPAEPRPEAFDVAYVETGEDCDDEDGDEDGDEPGSLITEHHDTMDEAWTAFATSAGLGRPTDEITVRIVAVSVLPPLGGGRDNGVTGAVDRSARTTASPRRFDG